METQQGGGFRLPQFGGAGGASRMLPIAGLVVVVLCGLCGFFFLRPLFGGGDTPVPTIAVVQPTLPPIGNNTGPQFGQTISLASAVGDGNRPTNPTTTFPSNSPIIYAVIQGIRVPAGTTVFARWTREGQAYEDTKEIKADREYTNTFIEFHIQPKPGALPAGNYAVQFFVNGNPGPKANFTVTR
jgi:hypothetical protein